MQVKPGRNESQRSRIEYIEMSDLKDGVLRVDGESNGECVESFVCLAMVKKCIVDW